MHLSILPLVTVLLSSVVAQTSDNPFNIPPGFSLTAGQPTTLEWTPTTPGTVTLRLREGSSSDLSEGTIIKANIPNNGKFTFTPDPNTVRNSDYTIEIVSDSDPSKVNYTPQFVIESKNTVVSATSSSESASATSAASSSSSSSKSASSKSASSSATSSATSSASASSSSASSASSSSASSASSSSAKSSSASTASSASSASSTSKKASSSSASASASASSSASRAGQTSASRTSSSSSPVPTTGAAAGLMADGIWGAVMAVFMAVVAVTAW